MDKNTPPEDDILESDKQCILCLPVRQNKQRKRDSRKSIQTDRSTDRRIDRQTDRQTEQTDRLTRSTDRQSDRHIQLDSIMEAKRSRDK